MKDPDPSEETFLDFNDTTTFNRFSFNELEVVGPGGPMVTFVTEADLPVDMDAVFIELRHEFEVNDVLRHVKMEIKEDLKVTVRKEASGGLKRNRPKNTCRNMNTCPICKRKFRQLKKHMLSHSGERPHSCEYCGMAFSQKSNLNRHISCKHIANVVPCCYCGKLFKRNDKRKDHIRSAHPEKTTNNPAA